MRNIRTEIHGCLRLFDIPPVNEVTSAKVMDDTYVLVNWWEPFDMIHMLI